MTTPDASARDNYLTMFYQVLAHVDAHLDQDLSVERLAQRAGFSKFHFHRQWTAVFGLGIYEYVQLARLKRASFQLAFREGRSVIEVALDAGYESPEAFARAFKKRFGQTPSEFKGGPDWIAFEQIYQPLNDLRRQRMSHVSSTQQAPEVKVIAFPETRVAVLEHRGDPTRIGDSIRKFIEWRKANRLPPRTSATFNLLYGDPATTPPEDFRLDICASLPPASGPVGDDASGIVERVIPGGRCAVLRLIGSDDGLGVAFNQIYGQWLPSSGESPRDFPPFLQRVRFFPDVPEHEAITDLFLPLAERATPA